MRIWIALLIIGNCFYANGQSYEDRTITYILVDGLSNEVFQQELREGHLPNLEKLIGRSTYVKEGVGSFPSMTGYAYYPFLTGRKATESDILGLRWFDRSLDKGNLRNYVGRTNIWMNQDINKKIKTIFEYFPDDYTVTLNSILNRGVQESTITSWPFTTAKFESLPLFKLIKKLPLIGGEKSYTHFQHEQLIMERAIMQLEQNPKVQWFTLGGLDAMYHIDGMTDDYTYLLRHMDHLIGQFLEKVVALGQDKTRMIAVISDHGVSDVITNHHVPFHLDSLTNIRLRRGASTSIRKQTLDTPLSDYQDVDGHYVVNGNLSGFIYMRKPGLKGNESWRENLTHDELINYEGLTGKGNILDCLSQLNGVSFISYRDKDQICVSGAKGIGTITGVNGQYSYSVKGEDPLRYPLSLQDTLLSPSDWLQASIDTDYPYGIVRLYDLMTHPNMGDILLCSQKGYDLAADYEILVGNYKGGHGDLMRDLTIVPYILYIPQEAPQKLPFATSQEVGQLIFKWMGIE